MKREWLSTLLFGLSLVSASALAAGSGQTPLLRTNPFIQPDLTAGSGANGASAMEEKDPADLELRGTLVAGSDPMANIGGVILAMGEEVDGYRLVSIGEREVVLEKGGVRKTLTMDNEESETGND